MRIFLALMVSVLAYTPAALACGGQSSQKTCNVPAPSDTTDISAVEGERAAFAITGMKCGNCSAKIVAALNAVDGVKAATVDHATGKAQVVFQADKTNSALLLAAITATGYAATVAQ